MFKLALQLGKTVSELVEQLDNDEIIEWMAYDRIDPFGGYRTDIQTAQLLQLATQYLAGDAESIDKYLLIDPHPLPPDVIAERERVAEIERLKAETKAMTQMLFDEI